MWLPFEYAVRNLYRDGWRLAQTVGGTALVVLLVMGAHAVNAGMRRTLQASGSEANTILLGAGSEESMQRSEVAEQTAGIVAASLSGLKQVMSQRAVSPEIVHMGRLMLEDGREVRGLLRGVMAAALITHPRVVVQQGRFPGAGEVMLGRLAWRRLGWGEDEVQVGDQVWLEEVPLTVAGVFAAPGTVLESEVWLTLNDLRTLAQRDTVSAVIVRRDSLEEEDIQLFTRQRFDLELAAINERAYYEALAGFYAPVRTMTWVTALMIAVAAVFGGLNTLYAAFAARVREIATLQAIGFRRLAILVSFIQESLLSALLGTLLGAVAASLLFADRVIHVGAGAFTLRLEPETLMAGLCTGVALGLLGALPPAIRCLKPSLPRALREA